MSEKVVSINEAKKAEGDVQEQHPITKQNMIVTTIDGEVKLFNDFFGHKTSDGWFLVIVDKGAVELIPTAQIKSVKITQEIVNGA